MASKLRKTIFFLLVAGIGNLYAQNAYSPVLSGTTNPWKAKIEGFLDWNRGLISATVNLDLASAGIRLPTGRIRAESLLEDEYWGFLQPFLLSIRADSTSTVNDLITRGELSLDEFNMVKRSIKEVPPSLTADLAYITGRYTLPVERLIAALPTGRQSGSIPRLFIPSPAADYTGIIIIADTNLPIHGRGSTALLEPCLFPKIWDSDMTLIYEKSMARTPQPQEIKAFAFYAPRESIFLPTPSGLDPRLAEIVGNNPLRILAKGVYGISPTDPVIEAEDALLILSSENNRRLLTESRVAIVVDKSMLLTTFDNDKR